MRGKDVHSYSVAEVQNIPNLAILDNGKFGLSEKIWQKFLCFLCKTQWANLGEIFIFIGGLLDMDWDITESLPSRKAIKVNLALAKFDQSCRMEE